MSEEREVEITNDDIIEEHADVVEPGYADWDDDLSTEKGNNIHTTRSIGW